MHPPDCDKFTALRFQHLNRAETGVASGVSSTEAYTYNIYGRPTFWGPLVRSSSKTDFFLRVLARQCSDGFLDRVDGLHNEAAAVMTVRMVRALEVGQGHIQQAPPLGALGGGT